MNILIWIIIGLVALIIIWVIGVYNRFVTLRTRVREAISDIDVQLKRRFDLIPNLVEAVKGYMAHEKGVLENVTKARTAAMGAKGIEDQTSKNNILSNTLKTLFAVSENYPDLKANANFLDLQRELTDTENKIQASRRFYNTTVRDINILVQSFPSRIVAGMFNFGKETFFETGSDAERENVKVKF